MACRLALEAVHISVRSLHIARGPVVRTSVEIDDQLLSKAMRSSGSRTKKAALEAGLRLLVKTRSQGAIRRLRGKVQWHGDLNESRLGRNGS